MNWASCTETKRGRIEAWDRCRCGGNHSEAVHGACATERQRRRYEALAEIPGELLGEHCEQP